MHLNIFSKLFYFSAFRSQTFLLNPYLLFIFLPPAFVAGVIKMGYGRRLPHFLQRAINKDLLPSSKLLILIHKSSLRVAKSNEKPKVLAK